MEMERMNLDLDLAQNRTGGRTNADATVPSATESGSGASDAADSANAEFTPREIAVDTLHTLRLYIDRVVPLCERIPAETDLARREDLFQQLLDGLEVINEGLSLSRRILKPGLHSHLDLLEVDLLSILRDLCSAAEESQEAHRMELIETHLVKNLLEWREAGIPALLEAAGLGV